MRARFALVVALLAGSVAAAADAPPEKLAPYFKPPAEFATDFGGYRSPLTFDDGTAGQDRRRTGRSGGPRS